MREAFEQLILKALRLDPVRDREEMVGSVKVEEFPLARLRQLEDESEVIELPFFWLRCAHKQGWKKELLKHVPLGFAPLLKEEKDRSPDGREFEEYGLRLRVLRSHFREDGENVKYSELHRGAKLHGDADFLVENRHLSVEKFGHKAATDSLKFGCQKPRADEQISEMKGRKRERSPGQEVRQDPMSPKRACTAVFLNSKGAPAGDFATMVKRPPTGLANPQGAYFCESWNAKHGSAVSCLDVSREYKKACREGHDWLFILASREYPKQVTNDRVAVVSQKEWRDYYGPFQAHAWWIAVSGS
uniref:Uncharacterized protein n=1 Tax=Chromera velia CCMP2878 TaxID=1169474 RepID=A0A0G4I215_9ALVE|eukprot:Cvel_34932.t1-p1 / transcript=Cvel_34932.t1 / gene=Cvel_34932 / organism=Chromera_velia_CCMP2878 / gene_product=hypothetical protein / transcript_product=hypothetical protein / location=Cvel_scaffold6179:685-1587(+) / protein_length=301 / sequence_SO=supercontig / SO=protein_coding / is_pseudo=false